MSNDLPSHFGELRNKILFSISIYVISVIVLLPFTNYIFDSFSHFLDLVDQKTLIAIEVTSPFLIPLKLVLFIAFLVSLPIFIWQILSFMAPGLYKSEKLAIFSKTFFATVLFYTGVIFCLILVVPNALTFFSTVGPSNLEISTDISRFYSFALTLSFAFGTAFQVPLIINILISLNILNKDKIREYRGIVLVLCFVFGMIFTPPDVISQILLAVPMYFLFELGLLFSNEKKKKSNS
tara:strand:+ start:1016 stop:1726 length:711 start_codon:yes stop_codon:yes gene_type:complete